MNVQHQEIAELKNQIRQLEEQLQELQQQTSEANTSPETVSVPEMFKPIFDQAQDTVKAYFKDLKFNPSRGLIEVHNERYVLVRASSLSHDFFEHIHKLYSDRSSEEAFQTGRDFLFDIGHVLGAEDAKCFHEKMNLVDPIHKLSAGPVHFAYSGWAFVDILPESNPSPDENYFLKYHHPYSFEADSWLSKGKRSTDPVCIMNAAYSSGWCEESFGIALTAVEVCCRAKGDENCTFIMAPPHKIQSYFEKERLQMGGYQRYQRGAETPLFFNRKTSQEKIQASLEKIREQEHHWQALTGNTDDVIIVLDFEDRIQFLNRSYSRFSTSDYLGRSIYEQLPNHEAIELKETIQKAKNSGMPQTYETKLNAGAENLEQFSTWFTTKIISFVDTGVRRGVIMIVTDVTDRKKAEEVVLKSQQSLKEAQHLAHIGSWECNPSKAEVVWSKELYRIFELDSQPIENLYQAYKQKCHPDDFLMVEKTFEQALISGESFDIEHRIICNDGSNKYLHCLGEAIKNKEGKVVGLKGISQDITERKLIESHLEQAMATAQAGNRAKDVFLAIMSHEIRTPLNGVLGMLQLLKLSPLAEESLEMVEVAHQSGKMLLSLLNNLLDFSKIEAGRLELEQIPFDVPHLVDGVIRLQATTEQSKGIKIYCTIADDVPKKLSGDPTRLQQVLNNLLSNALKFTEHGRVDVEVSLDDGHSTFNKQKSSEDKADYLVCFSVSDTGIGIPAEQIDAIFEPFVQGDSSITRKYGGSGLGLSVSRRLVTAMGGQLSAANRPEGGCRIFFFVPLQAVPTTASAIPPKQSLLTNKPMDNKSLDRSAQHSARILVVEDNPVNQMVAIRMLEKLGFPADVAGNGSLGLEAIAQQHYDLVLMDMMMPVLNGVDATRQLRAREKPGQHLPVIAMTANISEIDRETCIAAGMDDFLPKPIAIDAMKIILARWLKLDEKTDPASLVTARLTPAAGILNRAVLTELRGLLNDDFEQTLQTFFTDTEQCIKTLREAGSHGQHELLVRQAHTLKGSSSNFGTIELTELCAALQHRGANLPPEEALKSVDGIVEAFQRAKIALETELEPYKTP